MVVEAAPYLATVFLSAFLLFQVQPMIGKYILPWFGGSASVWTTCLLFFQTALLAGYTYAHVVGERLRRSQAWVHLAFVGAALLLIPISPEPGFWQDVAEASPTAGILVLLTVCVGPPYLVLASTGPLLQS